MSEPQVIGPKRRRPRDLLVVIGFGLLYIAYGMSPLAVAMLLPPECTRRGSWSNLLVLIVLMAFWGSVAWVAGEIGARMRQRSLLAFKPPWWPLIARGGVLLGGPLLLGLILDRHPLAVQIAGASYPASWPVAAVLFASWALMCGTLLRYHRFRSDNPLEYLNIDLAETDVGISESRVALRPWNSLEVVSCNLSAEGVRTGGAGLVLKVMYRMPWLRRAGFRAVVRAAVTNDQIVARFDASSEEVFPDEAREGLEAFLKSARASLSMHPGWTIVVTPGDLLLWLPDSPRPAEVARIMAGLASEWAHVERPRPVGYRDIQPPAATPDEIARIDRLADELWSALPEVPKEKHA